METFKIQKIFGLTFDIVLLCERESKMSFLEDRSSKKCGLRAALDIWALG